MNKEIYLAGEGKLTLAIEGTDSFRIPLSHDSSHWEADVIQDTDIPLTLSGHSMMWTGSTSKRSAQN